MNRFRSWYSPVIIKCSFWLICTVTIFVMVVFFSGCSGITPLELRNNREEGPEKGLFSGPGGEFVLVAPGAGKVKGEDVDEANQGKSE